MKIANRSAGMLFRKAVAYSLLETLIALVVLGVFVVLGYSLIFRHPESSETKSVTVVEQGAAPGAKPQTGDAPANQVAEAPPAR